MKKFELTGESIEVFGIKLFRVKAFVSFGDVKIGDMGGWVSKEAKIDEDVWIGGEVRVFGGTIRGGDIRGGTIWGGTIRGGTIRGGDIWGGTIRGGTIWGGDIRGGTICGGTIRGGDIRGGTIWGGAEIKSNDDFMVVDCLGSENRTTTLFKTKIGISVQCGCFKGTLDEFSKTVKKTHGDNIYGKEYKLLIKIAKIKFGIKS